MKGLAVAALVLTTFPLLQGCTECKGSSTRLKGGGAVASNPPTVTPVPAPPPASPPAASPATATATPSNPSVGQTVPTIAPNAAVVVDTSSGGGLRHLVFESTTTEEADRYLSEYIIVVHSKQPSCVSLNVRPTAGITNNANTTQDASPTACNADGSFTATNGTATATGTGTGSGTGTGTGTGTAMGLLDLDNAAMTDAAKAERGLYATGASLQPCNATRQFRMIANQSAAAQNIDPYPQKTGTLMVVGKYVRIWVDDEYSPALCSSGALSGDSAPAVAFGPLVQKGNGEGVTANWGDKLWLLQIENLASEMDDIYSNMTGTFGPISDVDNNGFVEIFLTPEVNRYYFDNTASPLIDDFHAAPMYRPQDLSFYNATTNPSSNEGEVLYLWTPDPAGIYNSFEYPSSDSVTSNYAKGYLASQLMTLIIANQRLIVQKEPAVEDPWLLESVALLASAYYAGNDYSGRYLAQYLTSRPAVIPLTQDVSSTLVDQAYMNMAGEEKLGMETMFGWYLHSRICGGSTVKPCAGLKSMLTSTKHGKDAVVELLGDASFDLSFENFGQSVAVSLIDKPANARAIWQQNPPEPGLPMAPTVMPDLTAIGFNRQTVEEYNCNQNASLQCDPANAADAGAGPVAGDPSADPTWAGPFPAKHMMMFQPLSSDNDLAFATDQDSISIIIVTGLIDQQTDVTAMLGQGLNVAFIPIGERDSTLRRLHIEKTSQFAGADLRPVNLTASQTTDGTTIYPVVYPNIDYSVTPSRQIWIMGSVDNFSENIQGTETTIGDGHAYDVQFLPCAGLTGTALTTCQGKSHHVAVQAQIRAFDQEVAPMLIVTDTDRTTFRGHADVARMVDLVTGWVDHPPNLGVVCEAGGAAGNSLVGGVQVTFTGTNNQASTAMAHNLIDYQSASPTTINFAVIPGMSFPTGVDPGGNAVAPNVILPNHDYLAKVVNATTFQVIEPFTDQVVAFAPGTAMMFIGSVSNCANGGVPGKTVYDHTLTQLNPQMYLHTYDNFLQLSMVGYPYTTLNSVVYDTGTPECPGDQCYLPIESSRQNFDFALDGSLQPTVYVYYPGSSPPLDISDVTIFDDSTDILPLVTLKNTIDYCTTPDPQATAFQMGCLGAAPLLGDNCSVLCRSGNADAEIRNAIASYIAVKNAYAVCFGSDCNNAYLLTIPGPHTSAWLPSNRVLRYDFDQANQQTETFYQPIFPNDSRNYCYGDVDPNIKTPDPTATCTLRAVAIPTIDDIRQQLNVPVSMLREDGSCGDNVLGTDFKACIDNLSWRLETAPDKPYVYEYMNYPIPGERVRQREFPAAMRAGEILAKPERIQAVLFEVPGSGGVANVIIGGRKQSQGKYMIRAHIID